jgi:hypothetical protein
MVALVLAPAEVGCSSCEAKCAEPRLMVEVSSEIAEVTVCDDDDTCTHQTLAPVEGKTLGRSFTVRAKKTGKDISVSVSAVRTDAKSLAPVTVSTRPKKGYCGCSGPGLVFVDRDGAHPVVNG